MKIRPAATHELRTIYLMGIDAWGHNMSEKDYLAGCYASPRYKIGRWFVLEKAGAIVASLIVFKNALNLPPRYFGIGSVATAKHHRNKGYASLLVSQVCNLLRDEHGIAIYLFSDIGLPFYQRLGFEPFEDICMVKKLHKNTPTPNVIPNGF
jgi:predicted N-acetyltransferase YhbS